MLQITAYRKACPPAGWPRAMNFEPVYLLVPGAGVLTRQNIQRSARELLLNVLVNSVAGKAPSRSLLSGAAPLEGALHYRYALAR
jgi:hypothetical protein